MTKPLEADAYWDNNGSVRCSSMGDAASQYHDPSQHSFESNGGRSIASLLPSGRQGLRGIVIPRATILGGSRGFDPHKPRLVNIDPDIKGQSCVVDLSTITAEKMDKAFTAASQNSLIQGDIRLRAAQTYHNLAIGYEPVGMGSSRGQQLNERQPPIGSSGYVVPRAGLGGGQILEELQEMTQPLAPQAVMSPSVTPRAPVALSKQASQRPLKSTTLTSYQDITTPTIVAEQDETMATDYSDSATLAPRPLFTNQSTQLIDKSNIKPIMRNAGAVPATKVVFEMKGWGTFEAVYHEVIRNDCLLVLCWNTKSTAMKYFPPATDELMAVKVNETLFLVYSYGSTFKHGDYEYSILIISQDGQMGDE